MSQVNHKEKNKMSLSWTLYPSPHGAATGLGDTVSEECPPNTSSFSHFP